MKILVVDDSALMRTTISDILQCIPNAEIKTARDGMDALDKVMKWQPDVMTLDINMPNMDGLTCLTQIMVERPLPIVMLSSLTHEGAITTLEALYLGAVDFVAKPGGTICGRLQEVAPLIREKVRAAAKMRVKVHTQLSVSPAEVEHKHNSPVVENNEDHQLAIMGVSTGGPGTVETILRHLPADFSLPIIVNQHMPESFTAAFAQRLNRHLQQPVKEINRALVLEAGTVYVCKGDRDCIVTLRDGKLAAMPTPNDSHFSWHPSVSKLVASAIRTCGEDNLLCVMLTGMGDDGADEMAQVAQGNGIVFAQEPTTCVVPSMPEALLKRVPHIPTGTPEHLAYLMTEVVRQSSRELRYGNY
ncbi:TPA: chemotaxis protein CheB [Vibrio cholerae]|nr:chemotaxis protein CheB [Vibrio cholerae]